MLTYRELQYPLIPFNFLGIVYNCYYLFLVLLRICQRHLGLEFPVSCMIKPIIPASIFSWIKFCQFVSSRIDCFIHVIVWS